MRLSDSALMIFKFVGDVPQGCDKNIRNVIVIQGVIDIAALSSGFNESVQTEQPKLMRDRGLGKINGFHQIRHAKLAVGEDMENANPGFISQYFKESNHFIDVFIGEIAVDAKGIDIM